MTNIILTGIKYLIIIFFAYFTYLSFRAQRDVPDERKKTTYLLQRVTMLVIHALAFLSICINISLDSKIELKMGQAIGLYAGQLVYLIAMSIVIPKFVSLSRGLHNTMCMFLTIGFIIQTRLNFGTSLRQLLIIVVGTIVFLVFVFLCKRAKFMRNLTWIYAIAGMAMLLLMLVLSRVVYGAKLAIDLGFFSFQPSEFVKILFVLFVASAFNKANNFRTVAVTAVCAGIHVLILVFCRDLGSALILFVIYMLMLYAATRKLLYIGVGVAALAVASVAAYHLFSHVRVRVSTWLDPWADIDNKGYQITQSLFAIGTGGWFGSGLFGGQPKNVPVVSNDMIFSAISEELGGIFSILLILLCLCFILMMFRVALRVNNPFYKLLAFGLGTSYGFQVFLTIGGTIKFIPLTGVNLPFISSGGSSLLASMIMIGMVQALYVISEADVEREREMVAAGIPISEFDNYQDLYEEDEEPEVRIEDDVDLQVLEEDFEDPYEDKYLRPERVEQMIRDDVTQRARIRQILQYEPEPVGQRERIRQVNPDEEPGFSGQRDRIRQVTPEVGTPQRERIRQILPDVEEIPTRQPNRKKIRKIDPDDF